MSSTETFFTEKAFEAVIIELMAEGMKDKETLIAFMQTPEFDKRVSELKNFLIFKFV